MPVLSGKSFWAAIATPNTTFEPVWSIDVALTGQELAKAQNIRLIGLGGVFDNETYSFVGFEPDSQADSFHIDKAFFSSTCVVPEEGTYENAAFNAHTKRFAAQRSDKVYLLADSNKLGKKALIRVLKTSQIDLLRTDKTLSEKDSLAFEKNNVEVLIAGNGK